VSAVIAFVPSRAEMWPHPEEGSVSVAVTLQFQVKPDKVGDVLGFLRKNVPDHRSYEGCESLAVHQSQDDPTRFFLYEQWSARPRHEAYLAWRSETGMLAELVEMLAGDPSFGYYNTVDG
jgi:quinol monooxygenase YgiN